MKIYTQGILPIRNIDDNILSKLKQSLLMFDKLGIPFLDTIINGIKEYDTTKRSHWLVDELNYLEDKDYVFKIGTEDLKVDRLFRKGIAKEYIGILDEIDGTDDLDKMLNGHARLAALALNTKDSTKGVENIPLLSNFTLPISSIAQRTDIFQVIIEKMPLPSYSTPWEDILNFKANESNHGIYALRCVFQ